MRQRDGYSTAARKVISGAAQRGPSSLKRLPILPARAAAAGGGTERQSFPHSPRQRSVHTTRLSTAARAYLRPAGRHRAGPVRRRCCRISTRRGSRGAGGDGGSSRAAHPHRPWRGAGRGRHTTAAAPPRLRLRRPLHTRPSDTGNRARAIPAGTTIVAQDRPSSEPRGAHSTD